MGGGDGRGSEKTEEDEQKHSRRFAVDERMRVMGANRKKGPLLRVEGMLTICLGI